MYFTEKSYITNFCIIIYIEERTLYVCVFFVKNYLKRLNYKQNVHKIILMYLSYDSEKLMYNNQ